MAFYAGRALVDARKLFSAFRDVKAWRFKVLTPPPDPTVTRVPCVPGLRCLNPLTCARRMKMKRSRRSTNPSAAGSIYRVARAVHPRVEAG